MKPIRIVPAETTGQPWVLWPEKAGLHGLQKAIYVVEESSTWIGGDAEGTHDGLRDGAQRSHCSGRVRAYWLAHDWVDSGRPLPDQGPLTPDQRLLGAIFGTLADAVARQRAEFAARAQAEAEAAQRAAACAARAAREREQREAQRRAYEERRERQRLESKAIREAWRMVSRATEILRGDGLDLPECWTDERYARAQKRILAESCTDYERAADIVAEEFDLLEENPKPLDVVKRVPDSPEFQRWFGHSKVVEENGEPLVVYHGTNKEFDAFDPALFGSNTGRKIQGFYFSDERDNAAGYGENIVKAYLSIKNPLVVDFDGAAWNGVFYDDETGEECRSLDSLDDYVLRAQADGHDGVIAMNVSDVGEDGDERLLNTTYVVFEPTQIKPAADSAGVLDPESPNIHDHEKRAQRERSAA